MNLQDPRLVQASLIVEAFYPDKTQWLGVACMCNFLGDTESTTLWLTNVATLLEVNYWPGTARQLRDFIEESS